MRYTNGILNFAALSFQYTHMEIIHHFFPKRNFFISEDWGTRTFCCMEDGCNSSYVTGPSFFVTLCSIIFLMMSHWDRSPGARQRFYATLIVKHIPERYSKSFSIVFLVYKTSHFYLTFAERNKQIIIIWQWIATPILFLFGRLRQVHCHVLPVVYLFNQSGSPIRNCFNSFT